MKAWHVLIIGAALGGGALFCSGRRQHVEVERLRAQVAALSSSLEEGQERALRMQAAQALLQRMIPSAQPQAASAVPAPPERSADPAKEDAPQAARHQPAEIAAHIDSAFSRESVDGSWSGKAMTLARERLGGVMPTGSSVLSLDCRSSMCRIETRHQSLMDYGKFVEGALMNPETAFWNGASFSTVMEGASGGEVVTVSFLARQGQQLPQL